MIKESLKFINHMQIFVNCLGETKCVSFEESDSVEVLLHKIKEEFKVDHELSLYTMNGKLDVEQDLSEINNKSVEALIDVLGGKKKKKKSYSTPKKNKHRHVNTRLRVLNYYAIKGDGTVERVKKLCTQDSCKDQGIFMANHFNRYYCGKCHVTYQKKNVTAETAKPKGKKK